MYGPGPKDWAYSKNKTLLVVRNIAAHKRRKET